MSDPASTTGTSWRDRFILAARWLLAATFIYSGMAKALQPADFLKLIHEYDLVRAPLLLNLIAATLPWFEVFCGLLLAAGVAVRGTAVVAILMLVPFTGAVWQRALELQGVSGLAFCAIRFDCGCGTGEVAICRKLTENAGLICLATAVALSRDSLWAVRHRLFRN